MTATADDAKRYCPCNSKCRGDDQLALIEDFDSGSCALDGERCDPTICSVLEGILKTGDRP